MADTDGDPDGSPAAAASAQAATEPSGEPDSATIAPKDNATRRCAPDVHIVAGHPADRPPHAPVRMTAVRLDQRSHGMAGAVADTCGAAFAMARASTATAQANRPGRGTTNTRDSAAQAPARARLHPEQRTSRP